VTRLFDTHCHLQDPVFDSDRGDVIVRAKAMGVVRALGVAEDARDGVRLLSIAQDSDGFIVPALGVHPDKAPLLGDDEVQAVIDLIEAHHETLGAVGEVGLDFRPLWDQKARNRQVEVLRVMIQTANRFNLPLSVHSRGAGHYAIDQLLVEVQTAVCMHAFDGRAIHAERAALAGFFFSIPPAVVRSAVTAKWVKRVPITSLLLESDSPVLGPVQGQRNEPFNLPVALRYAAELRGVSMGSLGMDLEHNTARALPRLVGKV
jgi:TatD DNase family protein